MARSADKLPPRARVRGWIVAASLAAAAITGILYWQTWRDDAALHPAESPGAAAARARPDAPRPDETRSFPNVKLSLVGTTWKDSQAAALIAVENQPALAYTVGQELIAGVRLRSIFPDRAVVAYGDLSRTLYLGNTGARKRSRGGPTSASQNGDAVATYEQKNPGIDPAVLTMSHINAAQQFLSEVKVKPDPRGGFVVQQVDAESVYEKLGLRPGDVVYSIDTAGNRDLDELSMETAMRQVELQMEVYRNGTMELLHTRLDQ
jgi:type II secretory pathway component PulC